MAPKGTEPFMLRTGVGDHTTSLATVAAILAGLYEREQTGKGRLVQTSLLATGVYAVSSDLSVQMKFGRLASMKPRNMPINPMSNLFRSADGHWFVHNPRGSGAKDWPVFCAVAGREDLIEDPRAATGRDRRTNSVEVTAEFDKGFGALPMEEIARRLDAADLAWAPLQTAAQVVADPQVMAAGAIVEIEDGEGGAFPSPAAPAQFPGADSKVRPRAPLLGEHTRQVLAELGYGEAQIEAMVEAGAAA
jgi:crotonobetainyl-CoA:carnitine CoA-transferase CaiB-like acyl-CoA transferase